MWQGGGWRTGAGKVAAGRLGGPKFACGYTGRNNWGVRQTVQPRVPGEIKPQNLQLKKPVRVEAAGETPSLTGEFVGETHRILECAQNHPPWNQHQKGPNLLVGSRGSE